MDKNNTLCEFLDSNVIPNSLSMIDVGENELITLEVLAKFRNKLRNNSDDLLKYKVLYKDYPQIVKILESLNSETIENQLKE